MRRALSVWSASLCRYGDIYPQTVAEELIAMLIICVGLVFFGIILGSIAEALQVSAPAMHVTDASQRALHCNAHP